LLPIDTALSEYECGDAFDDDDEVVVGEDVRHAPYPSPGGYAFRMDGTSSSIPAFQGECEEGWADQPDVMGIVMVAVAMF